MSNTIIKLALTGLLAASTLVPLASIASASPAKATAQPCHFCCTLTIKCYAT